MAEDEPIKLTARLGDVRYLHNNGEFSGPDEDGSAVFVGPEEIDNEVRPAIETRTYSLDIVCPDGRRHHRTVFLENTYIPPPSEGTPAAITEYNAAIARQNELDEARLHHEFRTLQLKCTEFTVPVQKHTGGAGHEDESYSGGTNCWCGADHGAHNYLGLATCWCGVLNEYRGAPR